MFMFTFKTTPFKIPLKISIPLKFQTTASPLAKLQKDATPVSSNLPEESTFYVSKTFLPTKTVGARILRKPKIPAVSPFATLTTEPFYIFPRYMMVIFPISSIAITLNEDKKANSSTRKRFAVPTSKFINPPAPRLNVSQIEERRTTIQIFTASRILLVPVSLPSLGALLTFITLTRC